MSLRNDKSLPLSLEDLKKYYYQPKRLTLKTGLTFQVSLVYNKLQTNWDPWSQIRERLYLGRIPDSTFELPADVELIFSFVTQGELAAVNFPFRELEKKGIKHIHIPMEDFTCDVSITAVINAIFLCQHYRKNGKGVYWHCKAGRARSGMALAVYLTHEEGITLGTAITDLEQKRQQVDIGAKKRAKALEIIQVLQATSISSAPSYATLDAYLASLEGKNHICELTSFKIMTTYLAKLNATQHRAQTLQLFLLEILFATDANWLRTLHVADTHVGQFLRADPLIDDSAQRLQMIHDFSVELRQSLKLIGLFPESIVEEKEEKITVKM